jgi:hypothetical protein
MSDQTGREIITVLVVPQPAVRPIIASATVVVFLSLFAILPWKLGFEKFLDSLAYFSATWLVILMFAPPIAFFVWLAFLPPGFLPRLEVTRRYVRIVPGRIGRFFAETPVEIDLASNSSEILFCHNAWQSLANDLRLIVRASDGTERDIRATSVDYLSERQAQRLGEGITTATGLPVLLLNRNRQSDGTIRETPWNPPLRSSRIAGSAALATGVVPLIGGSVVGAIWPTTALIISVGFGLWLSQMVALSLLARWRGSRAKFPVLYSLTTVFTFSAAYGLAVVVVHYIFGER